MKFTQTNAQLFHDKFYSTSKIFFDQFVEMVNLIFGNIIFLDKFGELIFPSEFEQEILESI